MVLILSSRPRRTFYILQNSDITGWISYLYFQFGIQCISGVDVSIKEHISEAKILYNLLFSATR